MKKRIEYYSFGEIIIDGARYRNDVIIHGERIIEWWRKEGHLVQVEDLDEVLDDRPDILIIGTGYYGAMKVSPGVEGTCSELGIRLIAQTTQEAYRTHNELVENEKLRISTALHLTC